MNWTTPRTATFVQRWKVTEMTHALWFFGDDGTFEYRIAVSDFVEYLFRYPRLRDLTWTFDGDGWTSNSTTFPENNAPGAYYVGRV